MTKAKKMAFANKIIVFCLSVCFGITAVVLYEYHRLDTVVPASVITALLGLFGGELMIIALRQIFGSDAVKTRNGTSKIASSVDENMSI